MRANRSKDTKPEVKVRSLLWASGYRYRLHRRDLPGNPDIVFCGRKKAVFVHGCFWHQHAGCQRANVPKSRQEYWLPKLERNSARDAQAQQELAAAGWEVFVVWECALKSPEELLRKLQEFLR